MPIGAATDRLRCASHAVKPGSRSELVSEVVESASRKVPLHLWLVGVIGILWNAMGAFDYLMTETENQQYLSEFTPEQLEFFLGFPAWVIFFWAIAVWGGVLGALLLLLRKRLATSVLLVSFFAMIVTSIHNFFMADGLAVMGPAGLAFSLMIFLAALGLWIYARVMSKRGILG